MPSRESLGPFRDDPASKLMLVFALRFPEKYMEFDLNNEGEIGE